MDRGVPQHLVGFLYVPSRVARAGTSHSTPTITSGLMDKFSATFDHGNIYAITSCDNRRCVWLRARGRSPRCTAPGEVGHPLDVRGHSARRRPPCAIWARRGLILESRVGVVHSTPHDANADSKGPQPLSAVFSQPWFLVLGRPRGHWCFGRDALSTRGRSRGSGRQAPCPRFSHATSDLPPELE